MNPSRIVELNRASPRYEQIKDYVLEMIHEGNLPAQARIPSETELVKLFGVSRMTVNRALRELADDGFVDRLAGVGTFVADTTPHSDVMRVRNIATEIRARGHTHSASVILLEEVPATPMLAERFDIRPGQPLYHSKVLHHENGQAIQLENRYVSPQMAPGYLNVDFTQVTPNVYLTKIAPLHSAEHIIRAEMPTPEVKKLLKMKDNEPCLIIRRRTWSKGRLVSAAELLHSGAVYELTGTMPKD